MGTAPDFRTTWFAFFAALVAFALVVNEALYTDEYDPVPRAGTSVVYRSGTPIGTRRFTEPANICPAQHPVRVIIADRNFHVPWMWLDRRTQGAFQWLAPGCHDLPIITESLRLHESVEFPEVYRVIADRGLPLAMKLERGQLRPTESLESRFLWHPPEKSRANFETQTDYHHGEPIVRLHRLRHVSNHRYSGPETFVVSCSSYDSGVPYGLFRRSWRQGRVCRTSYAIAEGIVLTYGFRQDRMERRTAAPFLR